MSEHEIFFRGKRKDGGGWVEGGVVSWPSGKISIIEIDKEVYFENRARNIEVIPESVGQYTGLKDKNGIKIFENDVIKLRDSEYILPVKWNNKKSCFEAVKDWIQLSAINWKYSEIIGNLTDNPELMK